MTNFQFSLEHVSIYTARGGKNDFVISGAETVRLGARSGETLHALMLLPMGENEHSREMCL